MKIGSKKKRNGSFIADERFVQSLNDALNALAQSKLAMDIQHVYLYGSCARGEQEYSSDIDLFVVLDSSVKRDVAREEILRLKGTISPTNVNDVPIDLHATIGTGWENDTSIYYKNIRKEGIDIWHKEPIGTLQKKTETF